MIDGKRLFHSLAAAALLLASMPDPAFAQPTPKAVKAVFLPKFARYVSWPPQARATSTPLSICIVGADPLGRMADDAVADQSSEQQPLVLKRMASMKEAAECQIAFLHGSAKETNAMLGQLKGRPVLTVTDESAGASRGIIHFVLRQGRVRFLIDDAAAAENHLTIDSRLLALALAVKQRRA